MSELVKDVIQIDDALHELVNHGKPEFPVAFYGDGYKYLGSTSYYVHWHSEVEVTIALKGNMEISCNDESILLKEGDAIFINSNVLHCVVHDKYPDSIVQTIVFNPVIIYGYHNSDIETKYVNPILASERTYIYIDSHTSKNDCWGKRVVDSFINAIKFYNNRKDGYELGIKVMLLDAWYTIYRNLPQVEKQNAYSSKVLLAKKAINYIYKNYSQDITLDDISNSCHLSKSELCKLFKKYINKSPVQYLLQHRIAKACFFLAYTDESITDIARRVGIFDPNYFAISFKKIKGKTPSTYRKEAKEGKIKDIDINEREDFDLSFVSAE